MDDDSLEALVPRLLVAFCRVFVACSLAALAALRSPRSCVDIFSARSRCAG